MSVNSPASRLATRLAFLAAGFSISCWAPLVPFAKQRLAVDDGVLGLLLLCLGVGSVVAMTFSGGLIARFGSKPVILFGGTGVALLLPLLTVASTELELALALFLFGASLGLLEVAMNVHAVEVEAASSRPLMSGFHALFSIGGFAGAGFITLLLSLKVNPLFCTLLSSLIVLSAVCIARPRFLPPIKSDRPPLFVAPRGIVILVAALAAVSFLAEGALLDWSALLITNKELVSTAQGGWGYMLFAVAMTAGRLSGDAITARFGDRLTMFWGAILAIVGFSVLLTGQIALIALAGFVLIGLGASNIVPVLFRQAGVQKAMPASLAVSAISIVGYAGYLTGPAGIGFVAKALNLESAFWLLTGLLCVIPCCAQLVTQRRA
ncbi:MFS transporter [Caballeronia sp. J97]|uniref:MFS transporter n=1 Tax=Caballeronia sp. J97 TaxID=2805429 RepID=UPI002AB22ED7|nr:MFS transporter [Caballeronia sp. J97]